MTAKGDQSRRRKEPLFLLQQRHAVQLRVIPYCLVQSPLRRISDVLQGKELLRKERLLETGLLVGQTAGHGSHISGLYRMCTAGLDSVLLDQKADEMTQAPKS